MKPTDTIKSGDAEFRIPTWASRPWAVVGVVLLAVAFATTTPAARILIAALEAPAPNQVMFDLENRDFAGTTPPDLDAAPREPARNPNLTARQDSPSIVRRDERQHQDWNPSWLSGPMERSADISRKLDHPAPLRSERNIGRKIASRVFAGLYRHLEAGLRHLTVPAFGSTAP